MKKIYLLLALATSLFATSCSQDELAGETAGKSSTVTFTVELPKEVSSSRAFGEGGEITTLTYAVYEVGNTQEYLKSELTKTVNIAKGQHNISVSIELANSKTYDVIFWAQNSEESNTSIYSFKPETQEVTINYTNAVANNEFYDAFYGKTQVTVNGTTPDRVELIRPFAQLNIGASDYDKAQYAGLTVTHTKITVKNVYNTLNLLTGDVSNKNENGETIATDVVYEFNQNEIPNGKFSIGSTDYKYLAMNYILVPTEGAPYDVTITNYQEGVEAFTRTYPSVPLQANYKTNVYGKLLTTSTDVNININPAFGTIENNRLYAFNAAELQELINNAPEGETIIYLGANIEGDVTVVQEPGVKITIDGCNAKSRSNTNDIKYNGSIKVHSNSYHYADAALTIKNVNFETSAASKNVIEALENGAERYSTNITVENCTFTATGAAVNTAVGVQIKASKNAKVLNCEATDMHSLIQAQSCDETIVVKDCTIKGKNGVAFKQVKAATVEGTTITAREYGIRFDGNIDNYGIKVINDTVTAAQPFIVRKMTGANNTITLEGTNTLTTEAEYQIVITNGSDDEAYVKPTGTYTLTGADNYKVYPRDYELPVASWDEFTAALAANEGKVMLTTDITYDANYQLQKDVVINLNGKSMTLPMINIHKNVTIKNGTINGKMYARTGCKATLEGLTFSGTISDDLSTEGHLQVQGGCDVYAKNCTFAATTVNGSQTRSLSIEGSSSGIRKFEGCDFKFVSWGNGAGKYKKNVYINTMSGTTTVDFTNCKLNGKAPNIIFAAAYPLTNLTMSGCDNTAPTLEISRAKDNVTDVEWAHISSLIANNKFTQVRVFYAGGSSEYIK